MMQLLSLAAPVVYEKSIFKKKNEKLYICMML